MVKGLKVLLLVVSVFLIVGCMDYKINMSIHDDKSVDVNMSMDINLFEFMKKIYSDDELRALYYENMFGGICSANCSMYDEGTSDFEACNEECLNSLSDVEVPSDDEIKAYLDEYFNSDEFNEDDFFSDEDTKEVENKGYEVETNLDKENYTYQVRISQTFAIIDNISSDEIDTVNLGEVFYEDFDNIFFLKTTNNTYQASYTWNMSNESTSDIDLNSFITLNYEVTLPYSSISNNATTVSEDGRILTWDLSNNNTIQYEFSFEQKSNHQDQNLFGLSDNTLKMISLCLIGGGSIGLVITIVVFIKKSKNN